jgi:peptide methionine sulfoxide reductase msrA/msrB
VPSVSDRFNVRGLVPVIVVLGALVLSACQTTTSQAPSEPSQLSVAASEEPVIVREAIPAGVAVATFAGGCFWCTEAAFQETDGVTNAISGYSGGGEHDPTYQDVYTGSTGHRESLRIYYQPEIVTYPELLDIYWRAIDPTDDGGQFVDRGLPYTTAIFFENEAQRAEAEKSKRDLVASGKFTEPIATKILPFTTFYEAEEYHQDFYKNSSERYKSYADASGREEFKELIWGEITKSQESSS